MKNNTKTFLFYFLVLFSIALVVFCSVKLNVGNDFAAADFRYDVNKLTCAALILEANCETGQDTSPFASLNDTVLLKEINSELKKVLIKLAGSDIKNELSQEKLDSMGIRKLNRDIYLKQLKELQFTPLTSDPDLNHYLVVTKGPHAGTIVYNGKKVFKDSTTRYFGLDLME